jgi:hypothetical protein
VHTERYAGQAPPHHRVHALAWRDDLDRDIRRDQHASSSVPARHAGFVPTAPPQNRDVGHIGALAEGDPQFGEGLGDFAPPCGAVEQIGEREVS